jgi:nucleotide-binding universal stress UspA family protein
MTTEATTTSNERRIVVGVDGSPCATRALEFATHEAAHCGALLHVVSVYHELPVSGGVVLPMGISDESANAIVSIALRRAEELEPSIVTKGEALLGGPGPGLVEVSEGATALVVGTRGHNQVSGFFVGSVSEYVFHHATCTTIVVR